jgi:hypothetical protein
MRISFKLKVIALPSLMIFPDANGTRRTSRRVPSGRGRLPNPTLGFRRLFPENFLSQFVGTESTGIGANRGLAVGFFVPTVAR